MAKKMCGYRFDDEFIKVIGSTYWFGTHKQNTGIPKISYELSGREYR